MAATVAGAAATEHQATRVDSHLALAVLRILTGCTILYALRLMKPWDFAGLGLERRGVLGSQLVDVFPDGRLALNVASAVFVVAIVAMIVGWHGRVAAWVSFALALWLLGVQQGLAGTNHIHHLLAMLAIVAAGPSDARLAVRPGRVDENAAAFGMILARVTVGLIYFFPGVAKLRIADEWIGERFESHLRNAQAALDQALPTPPDVLFPLFAVGALAFELLFVFAVFTRYRRTAVIVAIGFHLATGLLMGIWFGSLIGILPAFLLPMSDTVRGPVSRRFAVAGVLVVGAFLAGVAGKTSAWPVTHYPKFDHRLGKTEQMIAVATTEDGDRYRVGQVLIPHHAKSTWGKIERTHPLDALDAAVERKLGEPVEITWEPLPRTP